MMTIRNCNVAVVGGAGFLGSHLVDHLIEDRGCRVLVIDNLVAGRREFVHPRAAFHHHDITGSEEHLRQLFSDMGRGVKGGAYSEAPLFVFNYAARPYVPDSYARPGRTAEVNFMGALKVINAAQEAGAWAILQVSSAEVYGSDTKLYDDPRDSNRISETHEIVPRSSYGASKAAIDALCQVRWKEAKTPVIALRQFNCVGERETHPYVVPEIISQLETLGAWPNVGEPAVVKLGNNSFRDFMWAGDAVRIAVELLERGQFGEVYNLGSETGIKVWDLAKLIGKVMGFADVRVERDEARVRPWEIWHLQSDNSKVKTALTWDCPASNRPALLPLEEALRLTVRWFEAHGRRWPWERA